MVSSVMREKVRKKEAAQLISHLVFGYSGGENVAQFGGKWWHVGHLCGGTSDKRKFYFKSETHPLNIW